MQKTILAADQTITDLQQQFAGAKAGWDFDEKSYLSGTDFLSEVIDTGEQMGVKILKQDDRLYCYPFLLRVLPSERAILIDKKREKRLRPSILVGHLKELQNKPVRFKSDPFLTSLGSVYTTAVKTRGKNNDIGTVIPLMEIYDLLTPLPGQSKEYSRQEFGRDIYLLDQSGVTTRRDGKQVRLHTARGNEPTSKIISIVTREDEVKRYYGISFIEE